MTSDDIARVLANGVIDIQGRISDSSNQALFVTVELDGVTIPACYKTEVGERPLWDFPSGLWRREVAAYELTKMMEFDLIPVTVARVDGPYAPGSLQQWVENTTGDHYFTLRDRPELEAWFRELVIFDIVANNTDRKSGHVIFDGIRCWGIDQGLCFSEFASLRTVMWDFAENEIVPHENAALRRLSTSHCAQLDGLLSVTEIEAITLRAQILQDASTFPAPDEDGEWPPYPWPLI